MRMRTGKRIALLDTVRGVAVVNMILYHAIYDWVYVFGKPVAWFESYAAYLWEQAICWTFIFLAGMVSVYSQSLARHGAVVFGCAMVLTIVTSLAIPEQVILYGVLHLLGTAMLLTSFLRSALDKIPPIPGAVASGGLFLLLKGVPRGFIGVADHPLLNVPSFLYQMSWGFPLGFPAQGFWSSDYFPLVPWLFLFWTGRFFWRAAREYAEPYAKCIGGIPVFTAVGRHSLLIYMLHQPVVFATLWMMVR